MSLQGGFLQDKEDDAASGLFFRGDNLSVLAPQGGLGPVNQRPGVNSLNSAQGNFGGMNFGFSNKNFLPPQGNVPSHVSVASSATSVVATSGYFGTTQRSSADIDARQVPSDLS
jgi:hypothetical protein